MASKREAFAKLYAEKIKACKSETRSGNDKRGREMSEDPMLEYFREKEREKQGSSKEPPKYKGHFPLNRYNITPGYRWDGVDRSNGFEKKLLDRDGQKRAREEESYRDATRDL